jgi:dephospho-CoA kinase
MPDKKLKVAVTGSIGSGKSLFCKFLEDKGYPVIKADDVSKKILSEDKSIKQKVIKEFGKESFKGKEINKQYLAEKVFSDPSNVVKINSILHPEVKEAIKSMTMEYFYKHNIVFTEAALIYEADMEDMFDYIVLITSEFKIRMKRKMDSDNYSEEEFLKRDRNQIPDEGKKKRADFVFENNTTMNELKKMADLLLSVLNGLK